jgi:hypothetical protein
MSSQALLLSVLSRLRRILPPLMLPFPPPEKPAPSVQDKSSQPAPGPSFGANLSAILNGASQHDSSNNHAQTGTANPPNGPTALDPLMGDLRMQSTAAASQSHPQLQDKPQLSQLPDKPKKNGWTNYGQSNRGRSNQGNDRKR